MSRQYFADTLVENPIAPSAAITSTAETQLWNVPQFTPINAGDARAGKIYTVWAGGLLSMNTSVATLTMTPRIGTTTAGGTTLGASLAVATNTISVSQPWFLNFVVVFRSLGAPGANSGLIAHGAFHAASGTTTAGSHAIEAIIGGTLATADVSIAQGISIAVALSTGAMTTNFAFIQSFN